MEQGWIFSFRFMQTLDFALQEKFYLIRNCANNMNCRISVGEKWYNFWRQKRNQKSLGQNLDHAYKEVSNIK